MCKINDKSLKNKKKVHLVFNTVMWIYSIHKNNSGCGRELFDLTTIKNKTKLKISLEHNKFEITDLRWEKKPWLHYL